MLIFFASLIALPFEGQNVVTSLGGNVNFDANKEQCAWDHPYVYVPKWKTEGQVCVADCGGLSTNGKKTSTATASSVTTSAGAAASPSSPTAAASTP